MTGERHWCVMKARILKILARLIGVSDLTTLLLSHPEVAHVQVVTCSEMHSFTPKEIA